MHRVKRCGLLPQMYRSLHLSVGHDHDPYEMAGLITMPFGVWTRVGQRNRGKGQFGGRAPCTVAFHQNSLITSNICHL